MTTNYFKVRDPVDPKAFKAFFFDGFSKAMTKKAFALAWTEARGEIDRVSAWQPPMFVGPWDFVAVVGENEPDAQESANGD